MSSPPLVAGNPRAWLEQHLAAHQRRHDEHTAPELERRWVGVVDLLRGDAAFMREVHAGVMVRDGAPPAAAAKWLAGWYAGQLAGAVGYVYSAGLAGMLVRPESVRFALHPEGWAQRIDLTGAEPAVVVGHPWAGQSGVRVVDDEEALAALVVESLATAVEPLLEACRSLGKVGRRALWAEVADGFGLALLYQLEVPADPDLVARVRRALATPGAPWRKQPELTVIDSVAGPAYVGRKGGCCLAYRCTPADDRANAGSDPASPGADPYDTAYWRRFPPEPPEVAYCATCSLRDFSDCAERQLFSIDLERADGG